MLRLLALAPAVTFGLGVWQVHRLRWKRGLIAEMQQRLAEPPALLPLSLAAHANSTTDNTHESSSSLAYRRFIVRGRFLHEREALLGPRSRGEGQIGYFVVTPFATDSGGVILVNRGWIARDKRDQRTRPESLSDDEVVIQGLLRPGEKPSLFSPRNNFAKGEFHLMDVDELAGHLHASPVLLDALTDESSPGLHPMLTNKGIPIARQARVDLRDTHLEYAVTWFTLSAATTVMWLMLRRRRQQQHRLPVITPRMHSS